MQIQKAKQSIIEIFRHIQKLPLKFWIIFSVILLVIIYIFAFTLPIQLNYSFSNREFCTNKFIFLPDTQKQTTGTNEFKITKSNFLTIAGMNLASTKVCLSPVVSPETGKININLSPFGGVVFAKSFNINVGEAPKLKTKLTVSEPQALSKPLEFALDNADGLFVYKISINDQIAACKNISNIISCEINKLKLEQGKTYDYKLIRLFNNKQSSQFSGSVNILSPISITNISVSENEIIYDKPKSFSITTDKIIKNADVSIVKISNSSISKVETSSLINDKSITLSTVNDLERKSNYRIVVNSITAIDGSTLLTPQNINFKTSGGPTVVGINIATSAVDPNASIVISFDQAIDSNIDVSRFVALTGGNYSISRSTSTITIKLSNLSPCQAFNISVNRGLASGYGIISDNNWSYSSRTNCRINTETIGRSVRGRSILAYYYGTGSTTILFTGGIHGSEPSGKYILDDLVSYLDSNGYLIPADKQIVIVPNLNPDGIATASRYNSNGVNIDRNFDTTNWVSDIDTNTGTVVGGGGLAAMSEPETIAIANLTTRLQPRLEISYHAQGGLIGANQYGDSISIGNNYAANMGYSSMIGIAEEVMGYTITGEYEDWMGEKYNIPAILIELPGSSGRYFWSNQSTIMKMINI